MDLRGREAAGVLHVRGVGKSLHKWIVYLRGREAAGVLHVRGVGKSLHKWKNLLTQYNEEQGIKDQSK